jgi:energy-converting hydrogenase Eha subunit G
MCWCRWVAPFATVFLVHGELMLCLVGSSRCQLLQVVQEEGNGDEDVLYR